MGVRSRLYNSLKWAWQPIGSWPSDAKPPQGRDDGPIRKSNPTQYRGFSGADASRLTADWHNSGTSADAEIQGRLPRLRNNARAMVRDSPYAPQLKRLYRDNIIGPAGIQLAMKVQRVRGNSLDEAANTSIETAWKRWGRADSCDVCGEASFLQMQWHSATSQVDSGEFLARFVRQAFGKDNKIPLAVEMIEPDQLDLMYVGALQSPENYWRLGIERDKWGRAVNYAILCSHPGDYLSTGQAVANRRKHEIIPAADMIHVYFRDRIKQSRGYPVLSPIMADAHQVDGYESAVTVRARGAAAIMGFIETPELEGDGTIGEGEAAQQVMDVEPGTWRRLNPGEKPVLPDIKAPDGQYEMFVKNKGKRYAAGTGVSYSTLTRDAGEASYSSERQQYLQDQDAWSVLQTMEIDQFVDRVFREWLPLAVLAGQVQAPDFELRPNRYFDAVEWQPRGWSWVDPEKEAKAYGLMEGAGYISKMQVCAKLGTDYETVLKNRARQRALEAQYGDSVPIGGIPAAAAAVGPPPVDAPPPATTTGEQP